MGGKKGSALILTLVVVSFLMILAVSIIMVSLSSYKMEVSSNNTNRLNMMTESGVEVALAQVKKADTTSGFVDIMGLKSVDNTITCNVTFHGGTYDVSTNSYILASGKYTIESKASNATSSRTIRVPFAKATSTSVGIVPTDNLFFINGSVPNGNFNCGEANGSVYANGDFYMSSGSSIKGKLISTGNMTLTGGSSSTNGIVSFGDVNLDGGGNINGDALVKGNLSFGGGTNVNGNVQSDGNLIMPQGNIQNNATIGGNVTFDGGAKKIGGKLYYKGTATSNNGGTTVANYVPSGAVKTKTYAPVDLSNYSSPTLPNIDIPTSTKNPQMYNTATLNRVTSNSYTITDSGKLSSGLLDVIPWNSTLTLDATNNDISLLIDSDFKFDKQLKVNVVTGTKRHNVFIYLTGKSSFTVDNQFIGMQDPGVVSDIYIIGDGNQSIKLLSCELDAYVYIPNGSFSASGGHSPYMFKGSCVTKSVDIQGNISVKYLNQTITGTPLEVLNGGESSWIVGKWDN
ncbi:hypothetical protein [Clostridium estertheticum]|uniref:hypothetical protein n=1 Tax=Clostridium estertheticum TaxID=238834 RepID=UPI001C0C15AE|nr:hypothetical protein [Clostridium estertheticum]MBU3183877.1 hypothetical protein [Clostridium estertheticum]